jgi:hypothetical protein
MQTRTDADFGELARIVWSLGARVLCQRRSRDIEEREPRRNRRHVMGRDQPLRSWRLATEPGALERSGRRTVSDALEAASRGTAPRRTVRPGR